MMPTPVPKNEALTLCVGSSTSYFPVSEKIESVMDLTDKVNRKVFVMQHRALGWTFRRIQEAFNARVPEREQLTKQMIAKIYRDEHGPSARTPLQRFMDKWMPVPESGCWLWLDEDSSSGYGRFWDGKQAHQAHRFSYEHFVGPVPEGLQLDHLCRVRCCVNPSHLEPVTARENLLRGEGPPGRNARKSHCLRGHEFTLENTYRNGTHGRNCRTCAKSNQERYRLERSL